MATNPSSSCITFPFASLSCMILFLSLLCFINAWKNFGFLSLSLSQKNSTILLPEYLFCLKSIREFLQGFCYFLSCRIIIRIQPLTFYLSSSTSFSEFKLYSLLHWLKALRQLEICYIIFTSGGRSGDFHPSRINCLIPHCPTTFCQI